MFCNLYSKMTFQSSSFANSCLITQLTFYHTLPYVLRYLTLPYILHLTLPYLILHQEVVSFDYLALCYLNLCRTLHLTLPYLT